jgi:type II secretory pathway predicted ATPase ExeA
MGKTLLTHSLLDRCQEDRTILWLTNAHLPDVSAFYQAVLYDLGRPFLRKPEQEMRLELTDLLLESFRNGKPGLMVIDEAHHLNPMVLEELRLLGNLETREGRLIQIVLVGQPALLATLRRPELAGLQQRIAVRARLGALAPEEGVAYLKHLIQAAGGKPDRLFTGEALTLLAEASRGVPRVLNQAAHVAFQIAATAGQGQVDAEAVLEALEELGLGQADQVEVPFGESGAVKPHWTEEGIEVRGGLAAAEQPRRLFASKRRSA